MPVSAAAPARTKTSSVETASEASAASDQASASTPQSVRAKPSWAAVGIFLILLSGAVYFAQDVIVPSLLAFILALVLSPVVRFCARNRIPAGLTAGLLVVGAAAGVGGAGYMFSGPVGEMVASAPRIVAEVEERFAVLREPVEAAIEAGGEARGDDASASENDVQEVVIKEPGLLTNAAYGAPEAAAKVVLSLALLFFLLASGDLFYEKLVRVTPRFRDKKRALTIAHDIERTLSRYLFTITLINAALGVAVGLVMWALDMPDPIVWGVLAFAMNFVPYVGAILGVAFSGLVALVTFDDPTRALIVPMAYLACTTLEGQFITPVVVGQRLRINAVAIFLAVAFFGWMWGAVGMLIAVPMTAALKIVADNVPGLSGLAEFLSGRHEREVKETPQEA